MGAEVTKYAILFATVFAAAFLWRLLERLSSDAVAMLLGILIVGLPLVLLVVLLAQRQPASIVVTERRPEAPKPALPSPPPSIYVIQVPAEPAQRPLARQPFYYVGEPGDDEEFPWLLE